MRVVVVGQGYVGLPLAKAAVAAGHQVVGLELDERRVRLLNSGTSVVDDLSDSDVRWMLSEGYRASTDQGEFEGADVIVICVPTPLQIGGAPDLSAVRAALLSIADRTLKIGVLVVLESTTYPGTTAREVVPALEAGGLVVGRDLFVAYSPERIDPGNQRYGFANTPKVVGADDAESRRRAIGFYQTIVDEVVPVTGTAEAELTKLLENTYRHINIGLVNELAIVCHELGVDVWDVIRAASTKPFGFQPFYPGPGVGGHCIPIDPNYLSHEVRRTLGRPFRFVELAGEINSAMPRYIVHRIQDLLNRRAKALRGAKILLVGVTYKAGIADVRESPAVPIAEYLSEAGAEVSYFDPLVSRWEFSDGHSLDSSTDLVEDSRESDVTVLLQEIPGVSVDALAKQAREFFDTRGVTTIDEAERL